MMKTGGLLISMSGPPVWLCSRRDQTATNARSRTWTRIPSLGEPIVGA